MFAFVAKNRGIWPVALTCEALGVSRSGFYAWLSRSPSDRTRQHETWRSRSARAFSTATGPMAHGASGAICWQRASAVVCMPSSG